MIVNVWGAIWACNDGEGQTQCRLTRANDEMTNSVQPRAHANERASRPTMSKLRLLSDIDIKYYYR
jgi:hypothetical protein